MYLQMWSIQKSLLDIQLYSNRLSSLQHTVKKHISDPANQLLFRELDEELQYLDNQLCALVLEHVARKEGKLV